MYGKLCRFRKIMTNGYETNVIYIRVNKYKQKQLLK